MNYRALVQVDSPMMCFNTVTILDATWCGPCTVLQQSIISSASASYTLHNCTDTRKESRPIPEEPEVRLYFISAQVSQTALLNSTLMHPTHCLPRSPNRKYRSLQLIEVCAFTRRRRRRGYFIININVNSYNLTIVSGP